MNQTMRKHIKFYDLKDLKLDKHNEGDNFKIEINNEITSSIKKEKCRINLVQYRKLKNANTCYEKLRTKYTPLQEVKKTKVNVMIKDEYSNFLNKQIEISRFFKDKIKSISQISFNMK